MLVGMRGLLLPCAASLCVANYFPSHGFLTVCLRGPLHGSGAPPLYLSLSCGGPPKGGPCSQGLMTGRQGSSRSSSGSKIRVRGSSSRSTSSSQSCASRGGPAGPRVKPVDPVQTGEAFGAPSRSRSRSREAFSSDETIGAPPKTRRVLRGVGPHDPSPYEQQLQSLKAEAATTTEAEKVGGLHGGPLAAAAAASGQSDDQGPPEACWPPWRDLGAPPEELRPSACLTTGQTFLFSRIADGLWEGLVGRRVFQVRETASTTLFRCVFDGEAACPSQPAGAPPLKLLGAPEAQEAAVRRFFQLEVPLAGMLKAWGLADGLGARVLAIPPVEALFSFICSANNNIPRITLMVRRLCEAFGSPLVEGRAQGPQKGGPLGAPHLTWHAFPPVSALAAASVEDLSALGLGYRARLVKAAAEKLLELGGPSFLEALRWQQPEAEGPPFAHLKAATGPAAQLTGNPCRQDLGLAGWLAVCSSVCPVSVCLCIYPSAFLGVGRKVADCVALYGLGLGAAWPADTHLLQHALTDEEFVSYLTRAKSAGKSSLNSCSRRPSACCLPPDYTAANTEAQTFFLQHRLTPLCLAVSPESAVHAGGERASEAALAAKHLLKKQLSPQLHASLQDFYRQKYGAFAGWAQSALFWRAQRRRRGETTNNSHSSPQLMLPDEKKRNTAGRSRREEMVASECSVDAAELAKRRTP
ncbi:hypothetical protein Efla_004428 [Eimeria flavescens]